MAKRLFQSVFALSALAILLGVFMAGTAYAYAAYYGSWSEQPYYGNHWWYNYSSGVLDWYADDYWTTERVDAMRSGRNNPPWKEYRIEQEAYNPGGNSSCDRLVISSTTAVDLPVTGWSRENGCGSSSYLEELKIELDENAVAANTWIRHLVTYTERNRCSGGDGEVNYSFSNNWSVGDSWMGKINYDQCYDRTSSDPAGMVN